jgi:carbonic anhydrase/acetyltransferase-like protein (isoleucine patch superfamily)
MIRKKSNFGSPTVHESSYVDPLAVVIGRVIIEENVIVAPHTAIRADEGWPFFIGHGTNVQDQVLFHGLSRQRFGVNGFRWSIYVGSHCSIAHGARIHGPIVIGKKTFIGIGAIVWGSVIGRNCHVGSGAIIENVIIPPRRRIPTGARILCQADVNVLPEVSEEELAFNKHVVDTNKLLCNLHREVNPDYI